MGKTKKYQKTIKRQKSKKSNKSKRFNKSKRAKKGGVRRGTLQDLIANSLVNSGVTPSMLHDQNYPRPICDAIRPTVSARVLQKSRKNKIGRRFYSQTNNAYAWQRFNDLRRNDELSRTQIQYLFNYLMNTVEAGALNDDEFNYTYWFGKATCHSKETISSDMDELMIQAENDDEDDAEAGL